VGGADLDFFHGSGNLVLIPFRGARGWPYLSAGYGQSRLSRSSGSGRNTQGNAEAAAGLELWLSDALGVRLEARDLMWLSKDPITDIQTHLDGLQKNVDSLKSIQKLLGG